VGFYERNWGTWMISPAIEQPDCCASPVSRSFFITLVMVNPRNLDLIFFLDKKNLLKLSAEVLFPGGSNLIPLSACTSHFELLVVYILFRVQQNLSLKTGKKTLQAPPPPPPPPPPPASTHKPQNNPNSPIILSA
jgi:hypothetical protein